MARGYPVACAAMTLTQPAWGLGLATLTDDGQVLDVWFPAGKLELGAAGPEDLPLNSPLPAPESEALLGLLPGTAGPRPLRGVFTAAVAVTISSLADAPKDTFDVWLRVSALLPSLSPGTSAPPSTIKPRFWRTATSSGVFADWPSVCRESSPSPSMTCSGRT